MHSVCLCVRVSVCVCVYVRMSVSQLVNESASVCVRGCMWEKLCLYGRLFAWEKLCTCIRMCLVWLPWLTSRNVRQRALFLNPVISAKRAVSQSFYRVQQNRSQNGQNNSVNIADKRRKKISVFVREDNRLPITVTAPSRFLVYADWESV